MRETIISKHYSEIYYLINLKRDQEASNREWRVEKRKTLLILYIFNILNQTALLHRKAQYFLRNLETVLDILYYVMSYAKPLTSSNRPL